MEVLDREHVDGWIRAGDQQQTPDGIELSAAQSERDRSMPSGERVLVR
jgi:hypothetical protein